jgi:hypothetical protein
VNKTCVRMISGKYDWTMFVSVRKGHLRTTLGKLAGTSPLFLIISGRSSDREKMCILLERQHRKELRSRTIIAEVEVISERKKAASPRGAPGVEAEETVRSFQTLKTSAAGSRIKYPPMPKPAQMAIQ